MAAGATGPLSIEGPGRSRRLRGVLSPHIDFRRGGPVYTWSYRELAEQADIDTFLILGVAHQYCRRHFALTLKDFEPRWASCGPIGNTWNESPRPPVKSCSTTNWCTGRNIRSSSRWYGFSMCLARSGRSRSCRSWSGRSTIISSAGSTRSRTLEVRRFVDALKAAETASGKNVAYIGGIDLCHVGPEFGDPDPVDGQLQETVRRFDGEMLEHAAAADPARWFQTAATVANRWRVCGLAATYTMLHAMGPATGRLLHYDQALDDRRTCCVSFASMVFHTPEDPPGPERSSNNGHTIA